jgi:hypothetical protein
VGRVPLEQGIYNETRFVGTFVPFFRAPVSIYPEGIESIDGVALSYETPSVAGWSAQGTLSGGTSHYQDVIQTPVGTATPRLLFNPDLAAQFWIITPLQGLRFGANTRTIHYKRDSTTFHNPLWTASVDGTFNRFFVRAEHSEYNVRFASIYLILRYIQGGVEIAKGLSLTYQYDFQHWGYATRAPEISYDRAGGITYAITPNLHLKLERHRATGYRFDQYVAPVTGPGRTTYTIGSVSHSF